MIALLAAAALAAAPAPQPAPLTMGETVTLEALGEARAVNIVLPIGYVEEPEKRWPVVYLLDGGVTQDLLMGSGLQRWNTIWGRSENAILVGIETKDRQRELLPATRDPAEAKRWPSAGESAAFRAWLAQTVKPMIEARYRTDGRAFLVGESAAGHFVVETWAEAPSLFTGYAAISPSLQWDFEALSRRRSTPQNIRSSTSASQTRAGRPRAGCCACWERCPKISPIVSPTAARSCAMPRPCTASCPRRCNICCRPGSIISKNTASSCAARSGAGSRIPRSP